MLSRFDPEKMGKSRCRGKTSRHRWFTWNSSTQREGDSAIDAGKCLVYLEDSRWWV